MNQTASGANPFEYTNTKSLPKNRGGFLTRARNRMNSVAVIAYK